MRRIYYIDIFRVLALSCVIWQHIATASEVAIPTSIWILNIGQLGVAFFCIISGYLSIKSNKSPIVWLKGRFKRIYPSYWLVIGFGFIANKIFGNCLKYSTLVK